jgi:hypothetical protein
MAYYSVSPPDWAVNIDAYLYDGESQHGRFNTLSRTVE